MKKPTSRRKRQDSVGLTTGVDLSDAAATVGNPMHYQSKRSSPRMSDGSSHTAWILVCLVVMVVCGCGYTVLKTSPGASEGHGEQASEGPARRALDESDLPPGHPPITDPSEWMGRSFLDHLLGEDEPLRFENMRRRPEMATPSGNAVITFRATVGGPTLAEIWQIRMDEFGWVTAAYWTQGSAGPKLDESLATRAAEFRLARESEAALRAMTMMLLPQGRDAAENARPEKLIASSRHFWPYEEPGRIEIDYRIETLDVTDPDDWPGGRVAAPLDLVQLLVGTWDSLPSRELRQAVGDFADNYPLMVDVAILTEAIVLAWEVEGSGREDIGFPLRVGR